MLYTHAMNAYTECCSLLLFLQSAHPETAVSTQHLVPPQDSGRLSTTSDISLDMAEDKEHKTIWDNGNVEKNKNGAAKETTEL